MVDDVYLLVDFGSTYTKIVAVALTKEEILGRAQVPTTVQNTVLDGLKGALSKLTIHGRPIDGTTLQNSFKLHREIGTYNLSNNDKQGIWVDKKRSRMLLKKYSSICNKYFIR
jgi:hypothetical protein